MVNKLPVLGLLFSVSVLLSAYSCDRGRGSSALDARMNEVADACTTDADCGVVKADCCGCRQGGKQKAISTAAIGAWNAKLSELCQDQVCPQVISNDLSCKQAAICENGHCTLK